MSGWTRGAPDGRVLALVLREGAVIPQVAQYEPLRGRWFDENCAIVGRSCDVEWHPLPRHENFNEKTHADLARQIVFDICGLHSGDHLIEWVCKAIKEHVAASNAAAETRLTDECERLARRVHLLEHTPEERETRAFLLRAWEQRDDTIRAEAKREERERIVDLICEQQERVIARDGVCTTSDELQMLLERLLPSTPSPPMPLKSADLKSASASEK